MDKKITDKSVLQRIKLVVFDLDGTLLREDGEIGTETITFVKKLEALGVRFTFASGRLYSTMTSYAEALELQGPLISVDGALIKSYPDGKVISNSPIKVKHVLRAITLAERTLTKMVLCHDDAIYYTEHNDVVADILDKFGARFQQVESYHLNAQNTLEIVFMSEVKDTLKFIRDRFSFPHATGLVTSFSKSTDHHGMYYLELKRKGLSKAIGVKKVMKNLRLKEPEVAVLGDWYNDVSLFQMKTVKVAMQNAVNEIKFLADHITDRDNNDNGVAEFLELMLKAKT